MSRFKVIDCGACGNLHPVVFDREAGIDGDYVYECPEAGCVELHCGAELDASDAFLRTVVIARRQEA